MDELRYMYKKNEKIILSCLIVIIVFGFSAFYHYYQNHMVVRTPGGSADSESETVDRLNFQVAEINLLGCRSNCHRIAAALYKYSLKSKSGYPESLGALVPDYLDEIPLCPACEKDTYSESYRAESGSEKRFTFFCSGRHHVISGYPPNYPVSYSGQSKKVLRDDRMVNDPAGCLSLCSRNLEYIGSCLEAWAKDHGGEYPESLDELIPDYMVCIVYCPSAGDETYRRTYTRRENPAGYILCCEGHHHGDMGVPEKYPRYCSEKKLLSGK